MNQDRIIDIETKLAYQEHAIGELNDVIYRQQQQIDQLERLCQSLTNRLQDVVESTSVNKDGHEKPPHY